MTTRVPHKVHVSFDFATCPCGWYDTNDNPERLRTWVSAHEEAFSGHLIELEVFGEDEP